MARSPTKELLVPSSTGLNFHDLQVPGSLNIVLGGQEESPGEPVSVDSRLIQEGPAGCSET